MLILCSNEIDDQIEYAILTRNIYDLCGVQSDGFCTGVCFLLVVVVVVVVDTHYNTYIRT